jgi:hypothetical protein
MSDDHPEEWQMPCGETVWGDGRDAGDHEVGCEDCAAVASGSTL